MGVVGVLSVGIGSVVVGVSVRVGGVVWIGGVVRVCGGWWWVGSGLHFVLLLLGRLGIGGLAGSIVHGRVVWHMAGRRGIGIDVREFVDRVGVGVGMSVGVRRQGAREGPTASRTRALGMRMRKGRLRADAFGGVLLRVGGGGGVGVRVGLLAALLGLELVGWWVLGQCGGVGRERLRPKVVAIQGL